MMNFKQWHENNEFFREMKPYFGQCDKHQRLNLSELLLATSDTAVEDYHQRGMTYNVLKDNGVAILVSRVSLRIHRHPQANHPFTVRTWEEAPAGLQLTRRYELFDQENNPLVSGSSTWVVVNLQNRRIMRPSDFTMREAPTIKSEFCGLPCGKIAAGSSMTVVDQRTIHFSDIDSNGHMSNARYGAYIMDCLPEEFQQRNIKDFRINYAHEAKEGDKLQLLADFSNPEIVHVSGVTPEGTCFESELYF
ncbi:MAG: acyl-[acyl-carrier-protein] thioesterase [Spirochaetaceae bacterium]|nr:acyl-[acyl-carrier-protein] thioesterase [Spirochaetaceae bacterium]MBR2461869.1 acyl-[acyl-carrier-protein] thioesterase [Spirochaetaceae bacterium]